MWPLWFTIRLTCKMPPDLAAYYGAQKQAEMLNVIAHTNYQIRQSWKLLAWRYRVLGAMGVESPTYHPAVNRGPLTETARFTLNESPSVCVSYLPWKQIKNEDNICKDDTLSIPPLPDVAVIAPGLSINGLLAGFISSIRADVDALCDRYGAYNYWFAAAILLAFRQDQANRKQVINALAENLARDSNSLRDLDGNSVFAGVEETFQKNLTRGNSEGKARIELYNSLIGKPRSEWLSEIRVSPTLAYLDYANHDGCNAISTPIAAGGTHPRRPASMTFLNNHLDTTGILRLYAQDSTAISDELAYSVGFEKKPLGLGLCGSEG